ncbi:hypothetical protein [Luteolibacter luteus]|uniref:Uncharacterized protein n=1 Tax=Luteolibacter luteus TaxID=2728835 RepID=A0A858RE90_9BACT|nr:hypothetical protein [Luteolibacter luteus]QJE94483.1 hypothetical protein HHL09_01330 [Luteolibacter luteus]
MPKPTPPCPLPGEGEKSVEKVLRINHRWIVHGRLKENAAAYLAELREKDPERLLRASELALHLVHYKKSEMVRDPKPLFYAGLFAEATREEIDRFLDGHPMTRAITLLLHGDDSGLARLSESAGKLALEIEEEIREME